jgi:hypothetical protein
MQNEIKNAMTKYTGIIGLLLLVYIFSSSLFFNGFSYYMAEKNTKIFTLAKPIEILDMNFQDFKGNIIKAGSPVIFKSYAHLNALQCSGRFIRYLVGPVVYTYPPIYTTMAASITVSPPIQVVELFDRIPTDLPPGKYHMMMAVYPTCQNIDLKPYNTDMLVDINVIK